MSDDIRDNLAKQHPDYWIDERENDAACNRIVSAFEGVVEKLGPDAILAEKISVDEPVDIHMDIGQVLLGVTTDGVEALVIGTGVQPLVVTRNGVVGGADELDLDQRGDTVDYETYHGTIVQHVHHHLRPHYNGMPGEDEMLAELEADDDENDGLSL